MEYRRLSRLFLICFVLEVFLLKGKSSFYIDLDIGLCDSNRLIVLINMSGPGVVGEGK